MATRRTRIVCISDTHNQTPKLPSGDILIHAGDLTNQGTFSELQKSFQWLQKADFKIKLLICGNHDITCDTTFYQQYGAYFHNKKLEDSQLCIDLLQSDPNIIYLNHETKLIQILHQDRSMTRLKVFGSPYSPAKGFWAFGYPPEKASQLWDQIPLDADLIITHTPAKFHRDESGVRGAAGCQTLRETLWRVRPRLFVCGHIHDAYGVETVTWDLSSPNIKFKEKSVRQWEPPPSESKKQFVIDLSRAKSSIPFNDGNERSAFSSATVQPTSSRPEAWSRRLPAVPTLPKPPFPGFETAQCPSSREPTDKESISPSTDNSNGLVASSHFRQNSTCEGHDRLETCIVNAAFMATSFPHKGGKKFHRPIVIDMDLPVIYP